jgi:hypothetical protein
LIEKKDTDTFVEEYSRFLARPDVLGASFQTESGTFLGGLNIEQIDNISKYIGEMDYEIRMKLFSQLNTYMVSFNFY